jgi:predicted nucleotidyltransferase
VAVARLESGSVGRINLDALPERKRVLLEGIGVRLSKIPGVRALSLGGSYARGTAQSGSDLDIGVYYRPADSFRIEEIRRLAIELAKADPVVTGFYEWGPRVNGGAWIETDICKVDLLYRNLEQLEETIREAHAGGARHDFDQQPPFGFRGVIYLGELDCCIPLYDPAEELARLKRAVEKYPPALKHTIVRDSLWGAEFTLLFARGFARTGDVFNTVGCLTRIGHYLVQALFALNERYFVNDKRVFEAMTDFGLMPTRFQERIDAVLAHAGASAAELGASIEMTAALWRETVGLAGSLYQRRFALESLT